MVCNSKVWGFFLFVSYNKCDWRYDLKMRTTFQSCLSRDLHKLGFWEENDQKSSNKDKLSPWWQVWRCVFTVMTQDKYIYLSEYRMTAIVYLLPCTVELPHFTIKFLLGCHTSLVSRLVSTTFLRKKRFIFSLRKRDSFLCKTMHNLKFKKHPAHRFFYLNPKQWEWMDGDLPSKCRI